MSEPFVSHHQVHKAADAEVAAHDPVQHQHVNYWAIFGALCFLTLASVGFDFIRHNLTALVLIFLVLSVASFKAMFVMLYFMHLKFEGKWKFVLLAPTMILALAIIAALTPDIGVHYYDVQVPQMKEAAASHGGHGEAPGH